VLAFPEGAIGAVMFLDPAGRPSFVTATEAVQIRDGAALRWPRPRPTGYIHGWAALPESGERWLISDAQQLYHFTPPADSAGRAEWTPFPLPLGPMQDILVLARDAMGTLWIGTRAGLVAWRDGRATHYAIAHGLSDDWIRCIFPDRDGNLWIGTHLGGVCRLAPEEIASFTRTEGLASENVVWVRESIDGRIYATTQDAGVYEIGARDVRQVPGTDAVPFDKIWARLHRDRRGGWWFGTIDGFYHVPGPSLDLSKKRPIGPREGFFGTGAYNNIAEDSTGRIWLGGADHSVYVFDPDREPLAMHRYDFGESLTTESPRYFLCTRAGAVWMATYVGVWRLRGERWERLDPAAGIPDPDLNTRFLFEDSRGRVWIGLRFSGVSMTDEPDAERPRFVNYSTARGLPSNAVWAITEDETGRIYLGTGRGVCELDVDTGRTRVYTTADGLAGDVVNALLRDRHGYIWAGTSGGLSRIDPGMRHASKTPPPVLIARVEAGDEPLAIPERGAARVAGIVLPHSRNNLVVECAGISFSHAPLSYQWRMNGVDADWSAPSRDRTLRYAGLAPGAYTLHVRAVTPDGLASAEPAEVELRVLPPIWMRWWFLALCAAAIAAAALAWHRARIRRIVAMERIRRQIATDLHDDIGSGLSQIAILSEVAKRDAATEPALVGRLDELAELARAMREGMSDIVWAIDPRKDRLVDLVRRMQQVAFGLLATNGRVVEFNAPSEDAMRRLALPPDRKRHLFLAFKETVANVARHSGAARARIDVAIGERAITLVIEDDGAGFDPDAAHEGHGLASLRSRASALGARLAIDSSPGRGTRVELVVPLKR
jgi:signal transduction histidine kinase/outer membrane protein assembly factor BamB